MRLQNILSLIDGKLLCTPSIKEFGDIHIRASKIRRGDIFVAQDLTQIELAIEQGAYGIIVDQDVQMSDSEIAWIRVESIEMALLRLLRFRLLEMEPKVYALNSITLTLASEILKGSNCIILQGDLFANLPKLYSATKNIVILYPEGSPLESLFIHTHTLSRISSKIEIMEQTLFETSFILYDRYYEKRSISAFFMPYLYRVVDLFEKEGVEYEIGKLHSGSHFMPVFVNRVLQAKSFGQSDQVLIFEEDVALMLEQIEFLETHASYSKLIYILPDSYQSQAPKCRALFYYSSTNDIVRVLKTQQYNFALIGGQSRAFLDHLPSQDNSTTLFNL